jgi:hypothetical protein
MQGLSPPFLLLGLQKACNQICVFEFDTMLGFQKRKSTSDSSTNSYVFMPSTSVLDVVLLQLVFHTEATQNLTRALDSSHKNATKNTTMTTPIRYKSIFLSFMSFFDGTTYEVDSPPAFSVAHLLTITNVDIVRYLNLRTHGETEVAEGDTPKLHISTLAFMKKAISHYMPHHAMGWDDINQHGNPTMSTAVNYVIRAT